MGVWNFATANMRITYLKEGYDSLIRVQTYHDGKCNCESTSNFRYNQMNMDIWGYF